MALSLTHSWNITSALPDLVILPSITTTQESQAQVPAGKNMNKAKYTGTASRVTTKRRL